MKTRIANLWSAGLLVASITAHATVNFTTDTATDLVGTFSVTGTAVDSAVPSVFNFGLSFCAPVRASRGTTATVALQCAGTPDDPRATLQNILAGAQSSGPVSGAVSSLAGSAVPAFYFTYANLDDTGGAGGTFSGSFCFSRSSTGCPSSRPDPQPATVAGFYPPVEPPSVATNNAKAGQTIPLRFYAQTASGPITNLTSAYLRSLAWLARIFPLRPMPSMNIRPMRAWRWRTSAAGITSTTGRPAEPLQARARQSRCRCRVYMRPRPTQARRSSFSERRANPISFGCRHGLLKTGH